MLPHVVLDYGVLAAEPMLVPKSLEDPLGGVALLPGTPEVVYQDLVDDAGEGLILSLSKGWDAGAESVAGIPAALNRPESCAPCPGAGRTPGRPPGCSSHPPSPPVGPVDTRPLGTSIPPPISTTSNLWMAEDGTFFNRHNVRQSIRPGGPLYLRLLHSAKATVLTGKCQWQIHRLLVPTDRVAGQQPGGSTLNRRSRQQGHGGSGPNRRKRLKSS